MADTNPRTVEEVTTDRRLALSRNLQRLMDARRMSYTDLSRATGLSRTGLFKIADAECYPTSRSLFAIADCFGITLNDLYALVPQEGEK